MVNLLNNKFIAFLKLIRFENLLMIAFTQIILRNFVLQKIFLQNGIKLELNNGLFYLIVFSTVLIAAAGYIINDYFDVKTDRINHPDTVVVDKIINRRFAIIFHFIFTSIGLLIGTFTALKTGYLRLAIFYFAAAFLLWIYSTHLKKMLFIGNFVVSLLTAAITIMPFIFEISILYKTDPNFLFLGKHAIYSALKVNTIFSVFVFLISLAREIIKDIEDFKGDKATGCNTMPIVWGIQSSKIIVFFILNISTLLLFFVLYNTIKYQRIFFTINNVYILLGLILPLFFLSISILKFNKSVQFKKSSMFLKLIMLLGLFYSFIFYFN